MVSSPKKRKSGETSKSGKCGQKLSPKKKSDKTPQSGRTGQLASPKKRTSHETPKRSLISTKVEWSTIKLQSTFADMQSYVRRHEGPPLYSKSYSIVDAKLSLDKKALGCYPTDAPVGLKPVLVAADGNCFLQSVKFSLWQ